METLYSLLSCGLIVLVIWGIALACQRWHWIAATLKAMALLAWGFVVIACPIRGVIYGFREGHPWATLALLVFCIPMIGLWLAFGLTELWQMALASTGRGRRIG